MANISSCAVASLFGDSGTQPNCLPIMPLLVDWHFGGGDFFEAAAFPSKIDWDDDITGSFGSHCRDSQAVRSLLVSGDKQGNDQRWARDAWHVHQESGNAEQRLLREPARYAHEMGEAAVSENVPGGRDRKTNEPRWTATVVDLLFGSNSQMQQRFVKVILGQLYCRVEQDDEP